MVSLQEIGLVDAQRINPDGRWLAQALKPLERNFKVVRDGDPGAVDNNGARVGWIPQTY